jgi:hypothetical protein
MNSAFMLSAVSKQRVSLLKPFEVVYGRKHEFSD